MSGIAINYRKTFYCTAVAERGSKILFCVAPNPHGVPPPRGLALAYSRQHVRGVVELMF